MKFKTKASAIGKKVRISINKVTIRCPKTYFIKIKFKTSLPCLKQKSMEGMI